MAPADGSRLRVERARSESAFSREYALRIAEVRAAVRRGEPPSIIRVSDWLVLRHDGRKWRAPVIGSVHRGLMRVCHLITVMGMVFLPGERFAPGLAAWARELRDEPQADPSTIELARRALEILEGPPTARWEPHREALQPLVERCIHRATELELSALDSVTRLFLSIVDHDRDSLVFVVCAGHQPRYRELNKQYFRHLLQQRGHDDDECARRLIYAENCDESEAIELIAAKRLDRDLAQLVWGDPDRLERDVLGDTAADVLDRLEPSRPLGSQERPTG